MLKSHKPKKKQQQQQKSLTEYKKEKQENKTVEMNHNTYGLLFC